MPTSIDNNAQLQDKKIEIDINLLSCNTVYSLEEDVEANLIKGNTFLDTSFSVERYLNDLLPSEKSIEKIGLIYLHVFDEINALTAQVDEILSCTTTKTESTMSELLVGASICKSLSKTFDDARVKSAQAEQYIHDITSDILFLDCKKKDLAQAICFLKRLYVFFDCLDKWTIAVSERNYMSLAHIIHTSKLLSAYFCNFHRHHKIKDLISQHNTLMEETKCQLIEDFENTILNPQPTAAVSSQDICCVINSISMSFRREILLRYTSSVLDLYKSTFISMEKDLSELLDRRFVWLKSYIRKCFTKNDILFPQSWDALLFVSVRICVMLREQILEYLDKFAARLSPQTLFTGLTKCTEFEMFLSKSFYKKNPDLSTPQDVLESSPKSTHDSLILDLPARYKNAIANITYDITREDIKDLDPNSFIFRSYFTNCFGLYLGPWFRSEEQRLWTLILTALDNDKIISNESSDDLEIDAPRFVFASAVELMIIVKTIHKRIVAVSIGQILLESYRLFKKLIIQYLHELIKNLQKNSDMNSEEFFFEISCATYGTSEYLNKTCSLMETAVAKIIDSTFKPMIDMHDVGKVNWRLRKHAMKSLCDRLYKPIRLVFDSMQQSNQVSQTVARQESDKIKEILDNFSEFLKNVRPKSNSSLFMLLCDEFIRWFAQAYSNFIYSFSDLSESKAKELLNYTVLIKEKLQIIPQDTLDGLKPSSIYTKVLFREFGRLESFLKAASLLKKKGLE